MHVIFVINLGSTSLKLAIFHDKAIVWTDTVTYSHEQLKKFKSIFDQKEMRYQDIKTLLEKSGVDLISFTAIVSRGGPLKPLESGTYRITQEVIDDINLGHIQSEHITNVGMLIAFEIAEGLKIPSFFVDPISTDEFDPLARISGIPEIERKSLLHTLNMKSAARRAANNLKKDFSKTHLIVVHLGGGISICPIKKGHIVDVNNANEEGPFSPERAGSLPVNRLVQLCFSGRFSHSEIKRRLIGNGGLVAYLKTNDIREVEKRIEQGDKKAELIYQAMAYQISKEIGAMATVLKGKVDAIVITGGMAQSKRLIMWIKERISFIAPVCIYAGENEMESLALGVLRVLKNREKVKNYSSKICQRHFIS